MTLINRIKRAIFLDKKVYSEIAEDKGALVQAVIVVFLATVISEIVFWVWYLGHIDPSLAFYKKIGKIWDAMSTLWFVFIPILVSVLPIWFIETGIMHIVAKLLGGKADFVSYLKAIGFARAPAMFGVILFIGWIIGAIWIFTCYFTATKVVHGLSTRKAIIVAVIVPITLMILMIHMGIGIYLWLEPAHDWGLGFTIAVLALPLLFSLL